MSRLQTRQDLKHVKNHEGMTPEHRVNVMPTVRQLAQLAGLLKKKGPK